MNAIEMFEMYAEMHPSIEEEQTTEYEPTVVFSRDMLYLPGRWIE